MSIPSNLRYTKDHIWVRLEGEHAYIGVTDFAQRELGEIIFVDVPTLDNVLEANDVFASVEAVKTISDLISPLAGKVIELNVNLEEQPELINEDPYNAGWIIKLKVNDIQAYQALLSAEAYAHLIAQ